MANYYGAARSNYFKVKDEAAFFAAMENVPDIEVHGDDEKGFCVLVAGGDYGGWPTMGWNDETEDDYDIDVPAIVSEHLQDDEVAIFMESGAEKLRYIVGCAECINNKGERSSVSLNQIYELAADLTNKPDGVTPCEY